MGIFDYNQWSTVKSFSSTEERAVTSWMPPEDQDRINAYTKFDQMYWNDPRQYALRVLEGEEPIYIPNARTVVDTTAYYLLKGLELTCTDKKTKDALENFLKRERFYSRFHIAKQSGVARGDWVMHLTANPRKGKTLRLSLNSVDPSQVFPIWDDDEPGKMVGCHIAVQYEVPVEERKGKSYVRRLTYRLEEEGETRRIARSEKVYEIDENWFTPRAKLYKTIIPDGYLDSRITSIPIYWFKNRDWDGEDYGSSELRGLEYIMQTISQGATDVAGSLSLEGLGVYATDGGRPVMTGEDGQTVETEWEVAPGKVMEVPQGSYFRRVEGVGSITPATDNINYLEDKIHEATGLSDVALGTIDAQVASSGIALAIKFMPTLAKIEVRDQLGIDILTQLFYDWKTWYEVFEQELLTGDIIPAIGDKLPTDRTAKVNELNNMLDRRIISTQYYRDEMEKMGYKFPEDLLSQIEDDLKMTRIASEAENAAKDDEKPDEEDEKSTNGDTLPEKNESNNRNRPNESSGTEATGNSRDAKTPKSTRDA